MPTGFIPVPNTVKVSIIGRMEGQEIVNVLHFTKSSAPTLTDLNNLLSDVKTAWEANILPNVTTFYTVNEYHAIDLTTATGPTAALVNAPPIAGSFAGSALPANVALCITKRTALRGKSYRGRLYIAGLTTNHQANVSDLTTTAVGALLTAVASFLTSSSFHGFVVSVVSYVINKVIRTVGHSEPITAFSADTATDSQRRRLLGRGA